AHAAGRAGASETGLLSAARSDAATTSRSLHTCPKVAATWARRARSTASSVSRQANVLLLARRFAAPSLIVTSPPRPRCLLVLSLRDVLRSRSQRDEGGSGADARFILFAALEIRRRENEFSGRGGRRAS